MGDDNEVVFRFRAEGADLQNATKQADASLKNLAGAHKQLDPAIEHTTQAHFSMRHAMTLAAAASDMHAGSLMHVYYAMTMFGPVMGGAMAAILLLKEAMKSEREEMEKADAAAVEFANTMRGLRKDVSGSFFEGQAGGKQNTIENIQDQIAKRTKAMEKAAGGKELGFVEATFNAPRAYMNGQDPYAIESSQNKQVQAALAERKALQDLLEPLMRQRDLYMEIARAQEAASKANLERELASGPANTGMDKAAALQAKIAEAQEAANSANDAEAAARGVPSLSRAELDKIIEKHRAAQLALHKLQNEQAGATWAADREHRDAMTGPVGREYNIFDAGAAAAEQHRMKEAKAQEELEKKIREIKESGYLTAAQKQDEIARAMSQRSVERAMNEQALSKQKWDLERAQAQEHFKYRNEVVAATQGHEMASLLAMREEARREGNKAEMEGRHDVAEEIAAGERAKEGRMGIDAQRKLAGNNSVGVSGGADWYKQFIQSANKPRTPAEAETHRWLQAILKETQQFIPALRDSGGVQ